MVCEPESVNYCNQDPTCYIHPDGSNDKTTQVKPFDPNIVLQDYNKL